MSSLTVISPPASPPAPPEEGAAARIRRLQAEARSLARDQLAELQAALQAAATLCADVAEGGEAYPVGARELASRLAEDLEAKAATFHAIAARA